MAVDSGEEHENRGTPDHEPVVDHADDDKADHGPGSESEMSVVIDDEPAKKPKRNSSTTAKPRKSGGSAKKARQSKDAPAPTGGGGDEAEIDRLRSWLVKCGIRKKWSKELAPYDTTRAKIKHLRQMLSDAGMTGRYSAEKARRIKEERELNAEVQAVQESAQAWSKRGSRGKNDVDEKGEEEAEAGDEDEDEESQGASKPRKARNVAKFRKQYLALLDSEDDDGDNWRPS